MDPETRQAAVEVLSKAEVHVVAECSGGSSAGLDGWATVEILMCSPKVNGRNRNPASFGFLFLFSLSLSFSFVLYSSFPLVFSFLFHLSFYPLVSLSSSTVFFLSELLYIFSSPLSNVRSHCLSGQILYCNLSNSTQTIRCQGF